MKTLFKIYDNGNVDFLDLEIVKNEDNLIFNENYINVKNIIEYPEEKFRNYYVEKTISDGYITSQGEESYKPGEIVPPNENDVTSDFINVEGWEDLTVRIRFLRMNGLYKAFVGVHCFDSNRGFVYSFYDDHASEDTTGNFMYTLKIPINISYIRVSSNYHNVEGVEVQKTVEKGISDNIKHFKSYEDMPEWVKYSENNFSIFEEGLIIKGDILKNGEIIL